jgi:D-mannonate dehydratase
MDDIEEKLERLEEFDNETRLQLLYYEVNHITSHGLQPNLDWYLNRVNYIQEYHTIDWKDLALRSYQRDETVYEAAITIIDHLEELADEWSSNPTFSLYVYQRLLESIRGLWNYYSREYHVLDHTQTVDILDLMNGMDKM